MITENPPEAPPAESTQPIPPKPLPQAKKLATSVLVVGLAGSGKSTLMHALNSFTYENKVPAYYVNLDPATAELDFAANVDIRDSVEYSKVMDNFHLGPNGAILTSLNLFATKFHEVVQLLQSKEDSLKFAFFDTPGQIEAFAWSASGGMITQELASTFPTVILFVVDIPRCGQTATFISTMLYACSILYRSELPIVLALTKSDVSPSDQIISWMTDNDTFEEAISKERESSYFADFNRSTGTIFSELYKTMPVVTVSGMTGEGIPQLLEAIENLARRHVKTPKKTDS